jgi:hypothetical protein
VSPKHKSAAGPPPQPPKRTASLLSEEITPPREELPASPPSRMVLYDDLLKDEDYSGELRPDVEAALTKETIEVLQIFTECNCKSQARSYFLSLYCKIFK